MKTTSRPRLGGSSVASAPSGGPGEKGPGLRERVQARLPGRTRKTGAETPGAGGADWAGSSEMAAKAVTAAFILALVAGPAALVRSLGADEPVVVTKSVAAEGPGSDTSTLAGERGLQTVRGWLSSTSEDPQVDMDGTWPKQALKVGQLRVAQVAPSGDQRVWRVTVAAEVDGSEAFFAVPVHVTDGVASAAGLPTVVPAPAGGGRPERGYEQTDVAVKSPLAASVAEFLQAYLTGGQTTRVTSPGSTIPSVQQSPWTEVTLTRVDASTSDGSDATVADPAEGAVARVHTEFVMSRQDEKSSGMSSSMALTLTARGGRWEVTSVDPGPVLKGTDTTKSSPPSGEERTTEPTKRSS